MDLISRAAEIEERKGKSAQNVPKEDLISRKAAIDALDSINCCGYVEEPWDIVRGIIERVPAAEPEKRTEERTETHARDLIDRQETIEHLKKRLYETEFNNTAEYPYYQEIADNRLDVWMNEVPAAQPERKTGKWLPDNRPGGGFWVCSCCKFPSEAFAADVLYKFCPNCGAYMGGDESV